MIDLYFATHNTHKLEEIQQLLPGSLSVRGLADLGIDEIEENGATIPENSELKARFIYNKFHQWCFADDTGLEVEALNGEPGVYSARYAGPQKSAKDNINLLLKKLASKSNRRARFLTVITYFDPNGKMWQFEGIVKGTITREKSGNGGFGYDPIFMPDGHDCTFAEMNMEEKNRISHRGKSIRKFIEHLSR